MHRLNRLLVVCGGWLALAAAGGSWAADASTARLTPIARAQMCVTEGVLGQGEPQGAWTVEVAKLRAYLNVSTAPAIEVHFQYLGPSGNEARLGSGELRRQFGLKLRAQDACNLVYAMWRIEPESKLVVSVKRNPGQHSSAECGNRGYSNVRPRRAAPVPALSIGSEHTLRAAMSGPQLQVFADDRLAWEGSVGSDALAFDGPVGVRSDNVRLRLELRAPPAMPAASQPLECRSGPGEAE
jgi:hypothetical protein